MRKTGPIEFTISICFNDRSNVFCFSKLANIEWIEVELRGNSGKAIYIGEGLGHGFISLTDSSSVAYLLSTPYCPTDEFEINPLDPAIGIDWGLPISELKISNKDKNAPTLEVRKKEQKLPIKGAISN